MRQIYSRPSRRPPVFHPHTPVILSAAKKPRISSLLLLLQLPVLLPINGAVISTEATHAAQWRNPLVHLGFHQPLPCSCTAMYCSRTCRCLAVALCRCLAVALVVAVALAVVFVVALAVVVVAALAVVIVVATCRRPLLLQLAVVVVVALAVVFVVAVTVVSLSLHLPLSLLLHLPLSLGLERGFSPACKSAAKRPPFCRRRERSPKGEATDLLPLSLLLCLLLHLFFCVFCQKTHVKPSNPLTHYATRIYAWHFSSTRFALPK
jgi:hypothetical protein